MKVKITLLTLLLTTWALSQSSESIKAKSFSAPEYDKDGNLNCIIYGDTGTIYGKEAHISGALVKMYSKGKIEKPSLELATKNCKYLMKDKRCTSKESVTIKGDGVTITGVGFDIDNQSKKIFIRTNVKVIWKKAALNKKDAGQKTENKK